jgi:predicted amidohydrolase
MKEPEQARRVLRVALLQYPILWGDKEQNLLLAEQRIEALAECQSAEAPRCADIALLPEMFTTGFCTDRPDLAEPTDGETMRRLQALSDRTGIAICSSFICRAGAADNQRLYNRGFFIRPHDSTVFTDKAHLYAHGGEDRFFTQGRDATVIEYKGVKMRMLICYDLRFPVWARNRHGDDYDLLLVCANWPEIRIGYWDALVAARATENQCYICAVNPVGDDGMGLHYNGHSVAYGTRLEVLAGFADNESGTKTAEFDIDKLHHFREVLPLWRDADKFSMEV